MSAITTHVLDLSRGRPAAGLTVRLEAVRDGAGWTLLAQGTTDPDGRLRNLLLDGAPPAPGRYRLVFDVGPYFEANGIEGFYPEVVVTFAVRHEREHYHVPLLLSPYGYSTYRGS
jgi:5-hydroxyisourate hydrolase